MSSKRTSRQDRPGSPTRRKTQIIVALVVVVSLFAGWTMLASPGALYSAFKQKDKKEPTVSIASFNSNSPSKEYIYAGGRLVATEEPTAAHHASTIGVREPVASGSAGFGRFYLSNSMPPINADILLNFGGPTWIPISGDWDGNGTTTIGAYDPAAAKFYLRSSNDPASYTVTEFNFGGLNWLPITGDWDGNGTTTIGVYEPGTATFYLRNSNSFGIPDYVINFGVQNWIPIAGDWDGNGTTSIGAYDPVNATFYLRSSNDPGATVTTLTFGAPNQGWIPISGDWDGNGTTTIGVYEPLHATFYLRNSNSGGNPDLTFNFGLANANWKPISGDWDGL